MQQQIEMQGRVAARPDWSRDHPLAPTLSLTEAAGAPVGQTETGLMQARFQDWAAAYGYPLDTVPYGLPSAQERYRDDQTHHAWLGWIAAMKHRPPAA